MTPLYVSDLSRPAGAAIDRQGRARCIACGTALPLAQLDIVGLGYRCARCTDRAQLVVVASGQPDVLANLPAADREALLRLGTRQVRTGVWWTLAGICLMPVLLAMHSRMLLVPLMAGLCTLGVGRDRVRIGTSTN